MHFILILVASLFGYKSLSANQLYAEIYFVTNNAKGYEIYSFLRKYYVFLETMYRG